MKDNCLNFSPISRVWTIYFFWGGGPFSFFEGGGLSTEALEGHFPACKFAVFIFSGSQICSFFTFLVCEFAVFVFPSSQICSFYTFLVCKFAVFVFPSSQICSFRTFQVYKFAVFHISSWFANLQFPLFRLTNLQFSAFLVCKFAVFALLRFCKFAVFISFWFVDL